MTPTPGDRQGSVGASKAALLTVGLALAPLLWLASSGLGTSVAQAASPVQIAPAAPSVRIPGVWLLPITAAPVIAEFNPPPQRWLAGHRGVDVLAPVGTAVLAAGAGRVRFVGDVAGRGVVVIDHGLLVTTYEPVSAQVAVGDEVAAGTPIGIIGAGGHCSERCLHWGAKRGAEYLDPLLLLHGYAPVLKVPW